MLNKKDILNRIAENDHQEVVIRFEYIRNRNGKGINKIWFISFDGNQTALSVSTNTVKALAKLDGWEFSDYERVLTYTAPQANEEATEDELVEDTNEPTIEQRLEEMAVAATITNKQVAELRAHYNDCKDKAASYKRSGSSDAAWMGWESKAMGIEYACKILGIEL